MTIFLITAPSGAGKTTITHSLMKKMLWKECISHTTRPMRQGEVEGITYYFVSREEFKKMIKNNELTEMVNYDGNYYGISKAEIERVMTSGSHVFIIVNYDGYKQIKSVYPDAVGIFLYMSKEDCMANMLLRGDSLDSALKRISTYEEEMKNRYDYDYVIKNVRGQQEYTENIIENIIKQYRI